MLFRAYRVLQYLSIDIAIGAVILLRFFSSQEHTVDWQVYLLLAFSIWLIYTADHIRDAGNSTTNRGRYVFHHNYKKQLKWVMAIVFISCLTLAFFIPLKIIIGGSALALMSGVYILLQSRLAKVGLKEVYISLIYTSGILLVPFIYSKNPDLVLLILLFILTYSNLLIFSWMEIDDDRKDLFQSIATKIGHERSERLIFIIVCFGLAISFIGFVSADRYALYFLLSFAIYSVLIINPLKAKQRQAYRTVGDGVFLLPIIMEFI